jgi:hypothetical protein
MSHNARLSAATSAPVAPFQWIPLRPSRSIMLSRRPALGATNSTHVGGMPGIEAAGAVRPFSFPPFRCSATAVGLKPSRGAAFVATHHNSSGIRSPMVCASAQAAPVSQDSAAGGKRRAPNVGFVCRPGTACRRLSPMRMLSQAPPVGQRAFARAASAHDDQRAVFVFDAAQ